MRMKLLTLGLTAFLGACGYVNSYEEAVYDWEPIYCYKSIGGVECYREPFHRDERRLVNYFGPHPSRYDKPEPPEPAPIAAPPRINYWVKDPEPIPRPKATGNVISLPWLDPAVVKFEADKEDLARLAANPKGTQALLKRMGIGPHGSLGGGPGGRNALSRAGRVAAGRTGPKTVTTGPGSTAEAVPAQPAPPAQPLPPVFELDVN